METTTKESEEKVLYDTLIMSHKWHGPMLVIVCSRESEKSSEYERILMTRECKESVKRANKNREAYMESDAKLATPPENSRVYGAVLRDTKVEFHVECSHGRLLKSIEETREGGLTDSSEEVPIELPGIRLKSSDKSDGEDLDDSIGEPQMEFPGSLMDVIVCYGRKVFDQNSPGLWDILGGLRREWELDPLDITPMYIKPVASAVTDAREESFRVPSMKNPGLSVPKGSPDRGSAMSDNTQEESSRIPLTKNRGLSAPKGSPDRGSLTWSHSPTPSELGLTEPDPPNRDTYSGDDSWGDISAGEAIEVSSSPNRSPSPNIVESVGSYEDNKEVASLDSEPLGTLPIDIPSRRIRDPGFDVSAPDSEHSPRLGHLSLAYRRAHRAREEENILAPNPSIAGSLSDSDDTFQSLTISDREG
ncbi:hypothetical protein BO78DRAFT_437249 [Aspergillus sclerotiicarbonarius CBS 121057]|uniref:Uncharacterized protein n=1 Tax=Aspergillus sclerotiicarbonarius (strain CBS 121057 / IBT 28362) TaxID=1448318 RepID=A0A319DT23_ASPSB|nr:hypothetical protein BO78DRAFT_437249 [Aspergillus sclerotiicarbonarius CBS 121057]